LDGEPSAVCALAAGADKASTTKGKQVIEGLAMTRAPVVLPMRMMRNTNQGA
jgi:hypothetical protein